MIQNQIKGTIKRWNDDKGFGFLESKEYSEDIFCHISAFKNLPKGLRPAIGDSISFQVKATAKGLQAINVVHPEANNYTSEPTRKKQLNRKQNHNRPSQRYQEDEKITIFDWLKSGLVIITFLAMGYYFYQEFREIFSSEPVYSTKQSYAKPKPKPKPRTQTNSNPHNYSCDGRQHCSQMGSYSEAKYFTDNCPNTKMDGNGDGIPCERQFGK